MIDKHNHKVGLAKSKNDILTTVCARNIVRNGMLCTCVLNIYSNQELLLHQITCHLIVHLPQRFNKSWKLLAISLLLF